MSHWHSGLPKLDIEPFDPTPLYDAVRNTAAQNAEQEARRRDRLRPYLIGSAVFVVSLATGFMSGMSGLLG